METETLDRPPMSEARAIAIREPDMQWLDIPRDQLISTLATSLYPGAKPDSIDAVLDYCEAARLNPILKPVHIVPMSVKLPNGKYEYRDVVMPGIAHYRTQASRTGSYLGKSAPEWGPLVQKQWGDFKMEVPQWCRITVKRLVEGQVAEFTSEEYWDENYATKGRDSQTPNAMWQKRPIGQLHKCAEAQALRMAFPELISDVTAEEMEGKVIDLTRDDDGVAKPAAVRSLDAFAKGQAGADKVVDAADEAAGREKVEDGQFDDVRTSTEDKVDEAPDMPDEAYKAFYEVPEGGKSDWQPGWKWINELFEGDEPKLTEAARQDVATKYVDLFWAVYHVGGKQQKAVLSFVEKHGVLVPPEKTSDAKQK